MPLTPETWLNEFIVNLTTTGNQTDPDIIQLANGNIRVCWTSSDNTGAGSDPGLDLIGQIFDPLGNRIGGEIQLNNGFFLDDEQDMDLAALPGGGFISVFEDTNASGTSIRLNEYDANGVRVSDNATVVSDGALTDPNYRNPVVAVSSTTSVLIAYEEISGGVSNIRCKIYNPTTDTYSAQISLIAFAGGNTDADVTALTNGNYVIVARNTSADSAIGYRIVNSAGVNVLGATFVTGTNTNTETDSQPTVTALTGGGFVIAWTNTDVDTDIEFRVYNAAGTQIGSGFAGDGGATDNNNESRVIALADGTFVIAWDNDEAGQLGVDVQHFSAAGAALGSVFTVSADTVNNISGVALGDGRFALVWDDGPEIQMEILDTRDNPNNPGVYTPDQWVVGTVGDDVFTAAGNAEFIHGWEGNDTITESGGTREYYGDGGNDTLLVTSPINADRHDGGTNGAAGDTIDWSGASAFVSGATFNLTAGTATLGGSSEVMVNFENVTGTNNDDIIIGNVGANVLVGLNGNDTFNGGLGVDTMTGGNGNDTYAVDSLADIVNEFGGLGGGIDTIIAQITYSLAGLASVERLNLSLGGNINGTGNAANNVIVGSAGLNTINGGAGNDTMIGGNGNDTYFVDSTLDTITEAAGAAGGFDRVISTANFTLQANVERLDLGGAVGINGVGNAIANTIVGNAGNNGINGAGGNDFLIGGAGSDFFGFNTALGAGNVDIINDFNVVDDTIILENAVFVGLAAGALNPALFGSLIVYNNVTGQTFFDTNGAAAGGLVQFATLTAGLGITAADFFVI